MRTFKNYIITILYGIAAIGLLIFCLETDISPTVEITFGNSATAFAQKHVLLILTVLFFLFTLISLVQELIRRPLIRFLSWLHLVITLICLLIFRQILLVELATGAEHIDYSLPENIDMAARQNAEWEAPLKITGIIFLAAQALFLLNVIITQFKKREVPVEDPLPEQNS